MVVNEPISGFMTVRQAATVIECTEKHVYNMIHLGRLEALRIGLRGLRVSRESISNYLSKGKGNYGTPELR